MIPERHPRRFPIPLLLALAPTLAAGAGVLIPSNLDHPDPKLLSIAEMSVNVVIDEAHARVAVRQIFSSHHHSVLEGTWIFALPGRASVSDFAVWDGLVRIPGVILERRRAEEIYQNLRWQAIDPGLLQAGEHGANEARRTAVFSARIVPIPAYGSKRIEFEYQEPLAVENLASYFAIPLRPDAYRAQSVGRLSIQVELRSSHPVAAFDAVSNAYPLRVAEQTPNLVRAAFEGRGVVLSEDFALKWTLASPGAGALRVATHRDGGPGFFLASALLAPPAEAAAGPRTVIALFDASLSMQWEKLERGFRALEALLASLRPADRFNVILFNETVAPFQTQPAPAGPAAVQKALDFVRASHLRGGTNLQSALEAGLAQASPGAYLVLIGDGAATRGVIHNGKLAEWYASRWRAQRPRTFVFATGDDANVPLLKMLARNGGVFEWVRSTEPIEFKLNAFLSKIGRRPLENLRLNAEPAGNFDLVYPLEDSAFAGSLVSWAGQYRKPAPQAVFSAAGLRAAVPLPERSLDHPQLPRTWARARVDALLEKIEREGEDAATVDEIIRLAREYKFVTPYTSFLAAPRALLRPRLIRPGDPLLRVRTDPSVVSVVALFPFGDVKKLRYLPEEDIWQTRFLAPRDLPDGAHQVRLLLRDRKGQVFRESKSFVILSKPPLVRTRLDKTRARPGETVRIQVAASETTRTIFARMYGLPAVPVRWNQQALANTADFAVPAHLPAGRYTLAVTAEDMAHNIARQEVQLEVLP